MPVPIDTLFPILLTLFGLLFGSFGNVVIWRVPRGESIVSPGSHCPHCGNPVRGYDNIPVLSWILLGGRCRDCSASISPRYPLVEALSGALFLTAALVFGTGGSAVLAAALFWTLLVLSFIDLDTMRLPNVIVGALGALGLAAAAVSQVTGVRLAPLIGLAASGPFASPLLAAILGSLLGGGVSMAIAAAYAGVRGRSGFGMGDVKLLAALGPFLGAYTLLVLVLGSILGAVVGIVVAMRSGEGVSAARIPFGPFLALGAVSAVFFGPQLWAAYARIAGLA